MAPISQKGLNQEKIEVKKREHCIFFFDKIDYPWFLEPHRFYVTEARQRLLSQFSDVEIDGSAKKKEAQAINIYSRGFDPDYHDESYGYEYAFQEGVSHWVALIEMKRVITLALTAGMYHMFDKAIRELMIRESRCWNWLDNKQAIPEIIWNLDFSRVINLLEWVGIDIRNKSYFSLLEACQLVVNVYKHGDGRAHKKLLNNYKQYYNFSQFNAGYQSEPRYDQLDVSEGQFLEFAGAITQFWGSLPEARFRSQIRENYKWLP